MLRFTAITHTDQAVRTVHLSAPTFCPLAERERPESGSQNIVGARERDIAAFLMHFVSILVQIISV